MALTDKKITNYQTSITALSNTPSADGVTAAQLKALFDGRTDGEVKSSINGIIDELLGQSAASQLGAVGGTIQQLLDLRVASAQIKGIRLNDDGAIEVTFDGTTWQATASSGHVILDGQGNQLAQRSRMQFANTVVTDQNGVTVVEGVKGEKGEKGDKGDTGDTGSVGPQGEIGKAWLPTVDTQGVLSFALSDSTVAQTGSASCRDRV